MIATTNPLVCYLIIKISYVNLLLITKLIVLGIEFNVFEETSFASDGIAKFGRETRPSQCIPKRLKNLVFDISKNYY